MPKFGNKSSLFYVFLGYNFKKLFSYLKSATSNLSISKITRKKMPKFWNKSALFSAYLGYNFKKLLPYLKSAPSNLSISKILRKKKAPKFANKSVLFDYFCARILRNFCRI